MFPWGPKEVALGFVLAAAGYAICLTSIGVIAGAIGHDFKVEDTGVFEAAQSLAKYSDERLQAAATGQQLPDLPRFAGDVVTARIAYVMGAVSGFLMIVAVMAATRRGPPQLAHALGIDGEYRWQNAWRPLTVAAVAYTGVGIYAAIVYALGVDWLEPHAAVPGAVERDGLAVAIFGFVAVVSAPLSEEIFFRGLVFGGLMRWGLWPALVVSGMGFAAAHLDPGTFIPFTFVGMSFALLFRRTGCLWDSMLAHGLFNAVSFAALLATR